MYNIALFFHVSGAIGYFVGISAWLFILAGLRRAQRVEQVRLLINLIGLAGPFAGISLLLLLASGLYMAFTAWSIQSAWILVALISLILMALGSAVLIEPRRRTIVHLTNEAPEGPLSQALEHSIRNPVLLTTLQTVIALLLGVIFLMTTKPDLMGSLSVMAIALVLGLISSMLVSRTTRLQGQSEIPPPNREGELAR